MEEVPKDVDISYHYSEPNTVTANTAMSETTTIQVDTRPSSELANEMEPQSLESLIVDSISKCSSIIEQNHEQLGADVADVTLNETEVHEVIGQDIHEEVQEVDRKRDRKVSLKSSNVVSTSNLVQVIKMWPNVEL